MLRKNLLPLASMLMLHFSYAQAVFQTKWLRININKSGYVTSISAIKSGKQYCPKGYTSPFMSLYAGKEEIYDPVSFSYNKQNKNIRIAFFNGSVASIKVADKKD